MKNSKTILSFLFLFALSAFFISCNAENNSSVQIDGLKLSGTMPLDYAEQFTVDEYQGGYSLVTIGEDRYLVVPENRPVPELSNEITVLQQPLTDLYVAASSAVDLFDGIGQLDSVSMTSTQEKDWTLPNVKAAIDSGNMIYIGKYRSPDFEALVEEECSLAIESTMIYHKPEVKEKIEELGIPVLVEKSSYESHPLGRLEWIKLYGLLMGCEEKAEKLFCEKETVFKDVSESIKQGEERTAAFFYISANGYVNIRKPGDYISKMIELAGGKYIFDSAELNVEDNALSTMNIQMESFYDIAKDADILIYNSTIGGELDSIDGFLEKSPLLADFKAVRNGNVWCTSQDMFQQTTGCAEMIRDMNKVIVGNAKESDLKFLKRIK